MVRHLAVGLPTMWLLVFAGGGLDLSWSPAGGGEGRLGKAIVASFEDLSFYDGVIVANSRSGFKAGESDASGCALAPDLDDSASSGCDPRSP
jgi:hypothetical protein